MAENASFAGCRSDAVANNLLPINTSLFHLFQNFELQEKNKPRGGIPEIKIKRGEIGEILFQTKVDVG